MQRLYEAGRSIQQIGVKLGRSMGVVHRHLRGLGIEMRPAHVVTWNGNQVASSEMERTAELYLSGLSAREVGAVVGRDARTVLYRLEQGGTRRRGKSEALIGRVRRTPHEAGIIEVYATGANMSETARVVGVTRTTVHRVLERNGVEIRSRSDGVRRAMELRRAGTPPPPRRPPTGRGRPAPAKRVAPARRDAVDDECPAPVPARPVRRAVDMTAPQLISRGWPGVSPRLLYDWRSAGSRASVDRADMALLTLGLLWWEVFDPAVAPGLFSAVRSRDVVAWTEAAMRASEVWGDG